VNEPREPLDPRQVFEDFEEYVPPWRVRAKERLSRIVQPLIWYQRSSFSNRLRLAWWDLRDRRADRWHAGPVRRRGPLRAAFAVTVVAVVAGTAMLATGGAFWGSGSGSGGGNGGPTGSGSASPGGGAVPSVEPAAHVKRDDRRGSRRRRARRRKRPRIVVARARAESETPGGRVSEEPVPSSPPPARSTPPTEPVATPAPPTPSPPVTSQPSPPPQGGGGGGVGGGDGDGGGNGGSPGVPFDNSD
jgi:hypothetical protein